MLQYFVKKCRTRVLISFIFKNKSKCIHIRSRSNNFIISITMLEGWGEEEAEAMRPLESRVSMRGGGDWWGRRRSAATSGFFFFIFKKIKILKIYVRFGKFQKYTPVALWGATGLKCNFFLLQICNKVPGEKKRGGLSPPQQATGPCRPP